MAKKRKRKRDVSCQERDSSGTFVGEVSAVVPGITSQGDSASSCRNEVCCIIDVIVCSSYDIRYSNIFFRSLAYCCF